jgi:hypothetical protein
MYKVILKKLHFFRPSLYRKCCELLPFYNFHFFLILINLYREMSSLGSNEVTFIMIKPDCVQRGLVGEVVKRFENKGYLLVAMKMIQVKYKNKQLTLI